MTPNTRKITWLAA